jgi:hypothetical protein
MNRNQWIDSRTRFGCAAAAALASSLVLTSVLWLFAAAPSPTPSATAAATPSQELVSAEGRTGAEAARIR